jgi:Flp pilus assembly secretin CpaC
VNLTSIVQPATAAAILAMSVVAIPEALAQEPTTIQSGPVQAVAGSAQKITMTMGTGEVFKTSAPYTKISVSDEKIVEVTPQSDREFVFTPRGIGSTNVFVFDEKNTLIATLDINVVGKTAREVREETYDEVPGRVRIYNRIYTDKGELVKPAFYHCNRTNCELVGEAPNAGPGPTGTPATSPKGGATTDNENSQ